jgi:heptosyltransferase-1
MLGTPVAATLRRHYLDARITYLTHEILGELICCCSAVSGTLVYRKDISLLEQRNQLLGTGADLIVDLAGSFKSGLLTVFSGAQVLHYRKQNPGALPMQHAVDNFLATLEPLSLDVADPLFPTISPPDEKVALVRDKLAEAGARDRPLLGLVPGVGSLRPHRAWISEGWTYLAQTAPDFHGSVPVLVGGPEDAALCRSISEEAGPQCINLAGALSLVETAALLKLCRVVVSGDTGPAHLAVAVGTRVIGLYGPTFPARSGPYGCDDLLVDRSADCRCHDTKYCHYAGVPEPGPGECMRQIMLEEIAARLETLLSASGCTEMDA